MMDRIISWLHDVPGRKRGIAVVAGIAAVILRHLAGAFRELCEMGYQAVCDWRLDQFSDFALKVGHFVDQLANAADGAFVAAAAYGLAHAEIRRQREKRRARR